MVPVFTAEQRRDAPSWWMSLSARETLFSDPRWLDLFARSRGEPPSWWFAAGRSADPEVGIRGTIVDAGSRKSMNPYRWLFEQTPYHDREPLDAAGAPASTAWFPALLCSYPGLDAYPIGAGDDRELVRSLLSGLVEWAAAHGVRTVVVGFVQPEHEAFAAAAPAAGFRPLPVATRANLPVAGRTASQVFASWSTQQRNNLRRLRRQLDARGLRVAELRSPLADIDALVELRCAHIGQHGKTPDPAEERAWLEPLLTSLADRVTVFGAHGDSRLRGFSLFVDDGRWWNAFAVARQDPNDDRDVYFELMFNTPVEQAAARGIAEISFGYGTGEAKRRRGCQFESVPAWYHAADPAVDRWLARQSPIGLNCRLSGS
jgi:predicted N-acyltransferase